MLSFSLVAEALTGLIYHRPLGKNSKFLPYTDDDSDLVADVDPDTLIRIVRTELKNVKAPGKIMSTTSFSRRQ